jgi:50S ribosomal protein L16 3-hydroxylase
MPPRKPPHLPKSKSRLPDPPSLLGGMSIRRFLQCHWQKKPLLIRQALPDFKSFLSPKALLQLAGEDGVQSRLVLEKGGEYPWQVRNGPFKPVEIRRLPRTHWTLLVQDVDKLRPEAADLLEHFCFVPSWRIDDVMISLAPRHGSVGPHVDSYDVFLLQANGHRRWQIDTQRSNTQNCIPDLDLCILSRFKPEKEWVLAPGDMLYLPPGVTHHGVALDNCLTYSIGFRSPSQRELLSRFYEHLSEQAADTLYYTDPDLTLQREHGEITPYSLRQIRRLIGTRHFDQEQIEQWFGAYITEPGPWAPPPKPRRKLTPAIFLKLYASAGMLRRQSQVRFAHINRRGGALLFVNGGVYPLTRALRFAAPLLSGQRQFSYAALKPRLRNKAFAELLSQLYNGGYLVLGK